MKEYIEREAARDLMEQAIADDWEIQYADDRLDEIPAADVVEVRHGRWEYEQFTFMYGNPYGCYRCSACGDASPHISNYCPNCGAKMDGGADDDDN